MHIQQSLQRLGIICTYWRLVCTRWNMILLQKRCLHIPAEFCKQVCDSTIHCIPNVWFFNGVYDALLKIRPHRFGGEGVLIGGQNSNTKCSMTFVNIAVAISALAGGAQKRFRTETRIRWCFRHFSTIFGCLSAKGYWNGILGHFGSFQAMEKRPKMKK